MVATPGTIPALTQYQPNALPLAGTEAVEIVNTTNATAAASYFMLLTDIVGKVPSVLLDTNPTIDDRFAFTQMATGLPRSCTLGNFGVPFGNLPTGGAAGTILVKNSGVDFDASFTTTISGEIRQEGGFAYLGFFNSATVPDPVPGLALSWNQSGGAGEVDLWNGFIIGSPGIGFPAFTFKQMSGTGTFRNLASIMQNGAVQGNQFVVGSDFSSATNLILKETVTGTAISGFQANFVRTDSSAPPTGNDVQVNMTYSRIAGSSGNRAQLATEINSVVGTTGPGSEYIVGINTLAYAKTGIGTNKLDVFGAIFSGFADAGLPNVTITGLEIDTKAASTVAAKIGIAIVDLDGSLGSGTGGQDVGLQIGRQAGARGYNYAIQFGFNPSNAVGEINNALLHAPSGSIPYCFDFAGCTFTTAVWNGLFSVAGTVTATAIVVGTATVTSAAITNLTATAATVTNLAVTTITAGTASVTGNISVVGTVNLATNTTSDTVIGTTAISTAATHGFLNIPTCAGTPTGTPTSFTGRVPMVFDTTNSQFWFYTGGAWKQPKTPAGAALVTWQ